MRFAVALAISIGMHAVLAVGLAVALSQAPEPQTLVTLDLSSIDLSFAEDECESATVAVPPPTPPTRPEPLPEAKPPVAQPPPPTFPSPPEVNGTPDFPAPKETVEKMPEAKFDEISKPVEHVPREHATPAARARETRALRVSDDAPPAPAPRQAKVDAPPRPRRTIRPDYPRGARQRGEQGDVQLEISVGADGRVNTVRIVKSCGHAELDASAEKAACEARFIPATSNGRPVSSTARLTLRFTLR